MLVFVPQFVSFQDRSYFRPALLYHHFPVVSSSFSWCHRLHQSVNLWNLHNLPLKLLQFTSVHPKVLMLVGENRIYQLLNFVSHGKQMGKLSDGSQQQLHKVYEQLLTAGFVHLFGYWWRYLYLYAFAWHTKSYCVAPQVDRHKISFSKIKEATSILVACSLCSSPFCNLAQYRHSSAPQHKIGMRKSNKMNKPSYLFSSWRQHHPNFNRILCEQVCVLCQLAVGSTCSF